MHIAQKINWADFVAEQREQSEKARAIDADYSVDDDSDD